MNRWPWIVLTWAAVVTAWVTTCSVVPVSNEEACTLAKGDWNEAWARCYP